ncbi:MAG: hypothetical protein QNJ22_14250 [Desulfosarcinaceae bacterium]|nr:hypothetical protein [Desulfosarcinaceae bacterium]
MSRQRFCVALVAVTMAAFILLFSLLLVGAAEAAGCQPPRALALVAPPAVVTVQAAPANAGEIALAVEGGRKRCLPNGCRASRPPAAPACTR